MNNIDNKSRTSLNRILKIIVWLLGSSVFFVVAAIFYFTGIFDLKTKNTTSAAFEKKPYKPEKLVWKLISMDAVVHEKDPELVKYGRELIANTAYYLGPKGKIAQQSNGMNCQNCHLDAGSRVWGNNYGAVASTYPKFRERSGSKESI